MNQSIFKAYDIRGIYPTDINVDTVTIIGKALVALYNPGKILLGHDARHGSRELMQALSRSITKEAQVQNKAITVEHIGFSSTPMFYYFVATTGAAGGAMITASHNPKAYNGVKVVTEGAGMVSGTQILECIKSLNLI